MKPTVETCSGNGVIIIERDRDKWTVLGDNDVFDFNYLQSHYGDDLIVQEALEQSPYIAQFNPTSINTLRLTVYRSVKTNECVAPSAAIRIGRNGALMDNAHQGGGYVGLDREGNLGKKVLDQWGQSCTVFNDIDFANTSFRIPNYEKVVDFAKTIGGCIRHHRLIALDIMIDQNGMPKLIEFNTGTSAAYGMWLFQYAGFSPFGEYTQEIIDYCRDNLTKAKQCITF